MESVIYETVQISKLTNYFPLPIKSESKRKHIHNLRKLTFKASSVGANGIG